MAQPNIGIPVRPFTDYRVGFQATPLVQRFFAELLRRRGQQLKLAVLLGVSPGSSATGLFDKRLIETSAVPAQSPTTDDTKSNRDSDTNRDTRPGGESASPPAHRGATQG